MAFSVGDNEFILSGAVMRDLKYTSKNIIQELVAEHQFEYSDKDAIEVCDQMYGTLKRTMKKVIHQLAEEYKFEVDDAEYFLRTKTISEMNQTTLIEQCRKRGIETYGKDIAQLKNEMVTFTIDQLWDMDKNTLIAHCKNHGILVDLKSTGQLKRLLYALIEEPNSIIDQLWDMDKNTLISHCKTKGIQVDSKSTVQLKRELFASLR